MLMQLNSLPIYKLSDFSITELSIDHLPDELFLEIFQMLSLKDFWSACLVCRRWRIITGDSTITNVQVLREIIAVKELFLIPAKCSALMPVPHHWNCPTLVFSSIHEDIIVFHPPFSAQSSKFFSFTSSFPFSDRNVFLCRYNNTYFLTPQGQSQLSSSDLPPLESHKLVAINIKDSTKNREFSLLGNLPTTTEYLYYFQIRKCFPISEDKIVIFSSKRISFWNLSDALPKCYKEFEVDYHPKICKVSDYLILSNKILNLNNASLIDHQFNFNDDNFIAFKSSLCAYSFETNEIRYFVINDEGILEKKWTLVADTLLRYVDPNIKNNNMLCFNFFLKAMNDKFILLNYYQSKILTIIILNTNGKHIHSFTSEIESHFAHSFSYAHSDFSHLSNNILVFKNFSRDVISFWHIPTKKFIYKFDWKNSIDNSSLKICLLKDICLSDGKLTLLLLLNKYPSIARFCILQFDPQNAQKSVVIQSDPQASCHHRLKKLISSIYFTIKGHFAQKHEPQT